MPKSNNISIMTFTECTKKPIPVAFALGILGGAALISTSELTNTGPAIYIRYAILMLAIFATLRSINWPELSKCFTTSFLAFMVATVVLYLYIGIFDTGTILEISLWGHLWRLGLMAAIGGLLSFALAYLSNVGRSQIA